MPDELSRYHRVSSPSTSTAGHAPRSPTSSPRRTPITRLASSSPTSGSPCSSSWTPGSRPSGPRSCPPPGPATRRSFDCTPCRPSGSSGSPGSARSTWSSSTVNGRVVAHDGPAAPPSPAPCGPRRGAMEPRPRNVSELVTPPRKARFDFRVLSADQARAFLQAVKGDRLEALYVLVIATGMREGELFGLRWADVNLRRGSLHLVKRLKAESSRRQVLLPRIAVEALALHRGRQAGSASRQARSGRTTTWCSPTPWAGRCTSRTSCSATSTRCWSGRGCHACASMTSATARQRCCWRWTSIPRWSARCSATARSASRSTSTRT